MAAFLYWQPPISDSTHIQATPETNTSRAEPPPAPEPSNANADAPAGESGETGNASRGTSPSKFAELDVPVREVPQPDDERVREAMKSSDPYSRLAELAADGNGFAAFSLYGFLGNCERMPESQEALEAEINRMYETRNSPGSSEGNFQSDSFRPESVEYRFRNIFSQCKGVPADAVQDRIDWLRAASDAALPIAMEQYAGKIVGSSPTEAIEVYERLWAAGSATGAIRLGRIYERGTVEIEADPVKAVAYGFIGTEYFKRQMAGIENTYGSRLFENAKQANSDLQAELLRSVSPRVYDEAFELSKRLLGENKECCFN